MDKSTKSTKEPEKSFFNIINNGVGSNEDILHFAY